MHGETAQLGRGGGDRPGGDGFERRVANEEGHCAAGSADCVAGVFRGETTTSRMEAFPVGGGEQFDSGGGFRGQRAGPTEGEGLGGNPAPCRVWAEQGEGHGGNSSEKGTRRCHVTPRAGGSLEPGSWGWGVG